MSSAHDPVTAAQLTVVPANEASWDDPAAIFGTADYGWSCGSTSIAERPGMARQGRTVRDGP
jgi:hypothetical protein